MTPFRKPQARLALEGLVRGLAPHMASVAGTRALREVVQELGRDERLWAELAPRPEALEVTPISRMFGEALDG